jgi:hypothetical protein
MYIKSFMSKNVEKPNSEKSCKLTKFEFKLLDAFGKMEIFSGFGVEKGLFFRMFSDGIY